MRKKLIEVDFMIIFKLETVKKLLKSSFFKYKCVIASTRKFDFIKMATYGLKKTQKESNIFFFFLSTLSLTLDLQLNTFFDFIFFFKKGQLISSKSYMISVIFFVMKIMVFLFHHGEIRHDLIQMLFLFALIIFFINFF